MHFVYGDCIIGRDIPIEDIQTIEFLGECITHTPRGGYLAQAYAVQVKDHRNYTTMKR